MGKNYLFYCVLLVSLSACLPNSKFKEKGQGIAECDPTTENCNPPTSGGGLSFSAIRSSPPTGSSSRTPYLSGTLASPRVANPEAAFIYFYKTATNCTDHTGFVSGRLSTFLDSTQGIQVNATNNATTRFWAKIKVGNTFSSCTASSVISYRHSTEGDIRTASLSPTISNAVSPVSNLKLIIDDIDISEIEVYRNSANCTQNKVLNRTPASQFISNTGVNISLPPDLRSDLYVKSFFSNDSLGPCVYVGTFFHDDTAPIMSQTTLSLPLISRSLTQSPTANWQAAQDGSEGSGINNYEYIFHTTATPPASGWLTNDNTTLESKTVSFTNNTQYKLSVRAVDKAGNRSAVLSSNAFLVDPNHPILSITSPAENATILTNSQNFTGNCVNGNPVRVINPKTNSELTASCSNKSFSVELEFSGTSREISIEFKQNDGEADRAVTRTINYVHSHEASNLVAAGYNHSCSIKEGLLYCWGKNDLGEVGFSSVGNKPTPDLVTSGDMPISTRFKDITAGVSHSCALDTSGKAWCWGSNLLGQLGKNQIGDLSPSPVRVNMSDVTGGKFSQISAGATHTCALDDSSEGKVYCWGYNSYYAVGAATINQKTFRAVHVPLPVKAIQVSAGAYHSCAIGENGNNVYCWGLNNHGQLGNKIQGATSTATPISVDRTNSLSSAAEKFIFLAAGNYFTCALTSLPVTTENPNPKNKLYCWGYNKGDTKIRETLKYVPKAISTRINDNTLTLNFARLYAGGDYASAALHNVCGITKTSNELYCFGVRNVGQLGINDTLANGQTTAAATTKPTVKVTNGNPYKSVSIGRYHLCAKSNNHNTYCWGLGSERALGLGNSSTQLQNKSTPQLVSFD